MALGFFRVGRACVGFIGFVGCLCRVYDKSSEHMILTAPPRLMSYLVQACAWAGFPFHVSPFR